MSILRVPFKIVLLLLTGVSVHLSLSPPNPPVLSSERAGEKTYFEKAVRSVTFLTKSLVWAGVVCDALATIALSHSPDSYHRLLCPASRVGSLESVSLTFVLGVMMVSLSAILRLHCFRALGRLFTFEISIRPDHQLITDGPYSYVRHPSYTGVNGTLIGASMVLFSRGTWLKECGVLQKGVFPLVMLWIVKCAYALLSTYRRLSTEDDELRKKFGSTWDVYAERVPYKLVPGIY